MKSIKIKTTVYSYASNASFASYFKEITSAILSQPDVFDNLPVEPQVLIAAAHDLVMKTNLANRGGQTERDIRNTQRIICENYLTQLGNSVLSRASMEETEEKQIAIVHLSKFTLVKLTRNRSSLHIGMTVENVRTKSTGHPGQVQVRWNRIRSGIVLYEVQQTFADPNSAEVDWQKAGTTSRSTINLEGLPELKRFWVRVVGYGYNGAVTVPSIPAMCVAL